ncbi:MAG: BON domain-containing protein [Myxococcota bacterium]
MWKQGIFGAVLAAFLGYVAWVAFLSPARHQIEWDVATRVSQVLEHTGFRGVLPIVDGRDVELQGEVASAAEAERATRIVQNLRGVREVRSQLTVSGGGSAPRGGGKR